MNNLKVSTKLMLGFAAVLLLTSLLAVLAVTNQRQQMEAAYKLELANEVQEDVQHIRVLSYRNTINPDAANERKINQLLDQVATNNASLSKLLFLESNRKLSAELASDIDKLGKAFQEFNRVQQQREQSVSVALGQGVRSDQLIAELNVRVNGSYQSPTMHENIIDAQISRAVAEMMEARRTLAYASRGVLLAGAPALPEVERNNQRISELVEVLRGHMYGSALANINEIESEVNGYVGNIRLLAELDQERQKARQVMDEVYERTIENVDQILLSQKQLYEDQAQRSFITFIVVTLAAIVVGVLVSYLIIRQILSPLRVTLKMARLIGDGDVSEQNTVDNKRGDEFGVLLDAIGNARRNLRHTLNEVTGITTQLASAAEQLSAVTEQTSVGVNSQREETEQVATAMNEMTATVHEVAQNAEQAAVTASSAEQQAKDGNQLLQKALAEISRLAQNVNESAQAMQRVHADSESIGTVMTVINGIAEQTNLLALNAAIEAARAGEAGRGFAVVADEVRGLAQRTQESTAQIEQLIANLQGGSKDAVLLMEQSRELAADTLVLAQQAGDDIQAIEHGISNIQAMGQQIATAAEEQSSVAEEINRSIVNVNGIAEQSAAAVEETAASANELARLGQSLQMLVGRFRT